MIVVYGASDDLIEVEGDIREEFSVSYEDNLLGFSDGTLLRVAYDRDGCWRITRLVPGRALMGFAPATADDGNREDGRPAYSDIVTLTSAEISWVMYGWHYARRA